VPVIGRALDIGGAKAAAGREPFLYRDNLLEFDRGDLSRAAQIAENWFGVPVRFGELSLLASAAWNCCSSQSHLLHASSNRILSKSHTFPWIGP